MNTVQVMTIGIVFVCAAACGETLQKPPSEECIQTFIANNPLAQSRVDASIYLPLSKLFCNATPGHNTGFVTEIDGRELANQLVDTDLDGINDALLLVTGFAAKGQKTIRVTSFKFGNLALNYPAQTQAEMAVRIGGHRNKEGIYTGGNYRAVSEMVLPQSHTIGDKLFKYEGFGWESTKVAYRFYLDERGLIDIFGKKIPEMVLHRVGLDGDDYHTMSDWGMDILKVGPSLGLGGIAAWRDNKVQAPAALTAQSVQLHQGNLSSGATLLQQGWLLGQERYDLRRNFSITAGSHLTHARVNTSAMLPTPMAVGIVKHGVTRIEQVSKDSEWNYIATFGEQSLANDALGMVVYFRHKDLMQVTEDDFNELLILKPATTLDYYFAAYWSAEINGLQTMTEFQQHLEAMRLELNHPIIVLKQ